MEEYNILLNVLGLNYIAVEVRQKVLYSNILMADLATSSCTLIVLINTGISLGSFMNQTLIHISMTKNDKDRKNIFLAPSLNPYPSCYEG